MVYYDETFARIVAANLLLELDNFPQLLVDETTLTLNELLSLLRTRVVEAGVDLGLFVL